MGAQEIGTAPQVAAIAGLILARVQGGLSLDLAAINACINGAGGFTNSDLNGVVANSHSTGSVEGILRILAGEVYTLPAGVQSGAANAFLAAVNGSFTEARNYRKIVNTGALQSSALGGQLSKLKSATFSWKNPAFSYGVGGTALKADGATVIPTTYIQAALTVYDNAGAVI